MLFATIYWLKFKTLCYSSQVPQNGKIGMTIVCHWMVPKFDTLESYKAASRALDFAFGWLAFLDVKHLE